MASRLTVARPGIRLPEPAAGETVVSFDDFAGWLKSGRVLAQLARYAESRMLVHRLESAGRPLPLCLALRWMTRGDVRIEDARGRTRTIDGGTLSDWTAQAAAELVGKRAPLRDVEADVERLESRVPAPAGALDLSTPPLYLRSDLCFGVQAGGSVGHIAGVVNALEQVAGRPIVATTDEVATVDSRIQQHVVTAPEAFWNFRELPSLVLNGALEAEALRALSGRRPSFIYQRYSLNDYTGLRLARALRVPLVIEYNGSEIWMSRHWGRRTLKYGALSERIELLNLSSADLVVVVSRAMKDEVLARGVPAGRVLVNPNGVDPDRYSPAVDGSTVRARYGLQDAIVIGFIGTFGQWHGAETLAQAYVQLRRTNASLAPRLKLLMIGAGATLDAVQRIVAEGGASGATVFTGLVPQEQGAEHLAACDVLVSPHVPNPDGTPFFGSPTKLFEYMAMGKGIVASRLDQIGEILEDGKTALLVPPGDVDALTSAVAKLAGDRTLRECLGAEARRVALERHTWLEHTRRTLDALRDTLGRETPGGVRL